MHSPNAVRRAKSGSRCSGLWSPLPAANWAMSSAPNRTSRPAVNRSGGGTVEHQLLERADALLLEQGAVGQSNVEAGLELVHDADLGQRVPALDGARAI